MMLGRPRRADGTPRWRSKEIIMLPSDLSPSLLPRRSFLITVLTATLTTLLAAGPQGAQAQKVTATVKVGDYPQAIAINPVTNKIYVVIQNLTTTVGQLIAIDGATNATTQISSPGLSFGPNAIAVNSKTNKIYVTDSSGIVTVIDG